MNDREWAAELLSQQLWFWGQDAVRPEGNWLAEMGFNRTPPPAHRENCSSVYTLELSGERRIVLRGFGVFIGDDSVGGLFIRRYGFDPACSQDATLRCPPWTSGDLPDFHRPDFEHHESFVQLLLDLLKWIRDYEAETIAKLGKQCRIKMFQDWDDGERTVIPVDETDAAWLRLSSLIADNPQTWLSLAPPTRTIGRVT